MKTGTKKLLGKLKISRESLAHFQCGKCGKWWTIGDVPKTKKVWYCPWCGAKQ